MPDVTLPNQAPPPPEKSDLSTARRANLGSKIRQGLAHRRLPIILALLAVAICLPSLRVGWVLDDHSHRLAMAGSERFGDSLPAPLDMFRFFDGDPAKIHRLMDLGVVPWWTVPNLKGAFWRPVGALTHLVDYRLWPRSPWLMHAQSLLWYGALVFAVTVLYRRLLGCLWIAGLAGLLFALDDAHTLPVAWLANRSALIAALFGVLCIYAHDRRRRDGSRVAAILSPVLLALALLAKEEGIATCAYLAAYAICLDKGTIARRAATLWPYAVVAVAWRLVWTHLGYGVNDLDIYVDPLIAPWQFIGTVALQSPLALLGTWTPIPPDSWLILGDAARIALVVVAVVVVALIATVLWPLLKQQRPARFWATGMVLSLIPIGAVLPTERVLMFVGLGAMPLIALFLGAARDAFRSATQDRQPDAGARFPYPRMARWVGVALIGIHLVVSPVALLVRSGFPFGPGNFLGKFLVDVPHDEAIATQDLIIVNAPAAVLTIYVPIFGALGDGPAPRHTRALAPGLPTVTIYRPDARTLVIRPADGFLHWVFDRLFRSDSRPLALGDRIELTGLTIEITRMNDQHRPAEATFSFDVDLESPRLRWLQFKAGEFVAFTPPAIGETVVLDAAKDLSLW